MITASWILSVIIFSVSMSITPGPNNVMLTASGAIYGLKRTLPHIFGIEAGCFVLFLAVGLGLGSLFEQFPVVQNGLKIAGAAYLLYLAYKIAAAPPPTLKVEGDAKPLSFFQAGLFQFLNPKVWVTGLALASGFMPYLDTLWLNALLPALIMALAGLPCIFIWASFGKAIGRLLKTSRAWRIFNVVMGLMTAACVLFILA